MTAVSFISKGSSRVTDPTVERIALPTVLAAPDCLAAWDFYVTNDLSGNGRDIQLAAAASLDDAGALVLGTGANAYAICKDLVLPASFCLILSVQLGANTGSIFGNFVSTTTGFRLYSTAANIYAKVGDDAGRAGVAVTPTGWFEIGVSVTAGSITLCTEALSGTGTDASPLGGGICRFGSQEASGITAAAGAVIPSAALYSTPRNIADMRALMAIAKAKRIADGFGS